MNKISLRKIKLFSPFIGNQFLCLDDLKTNILDLKINTSKQVLVLSAGTITFTFTIMQYLASNNAYFPSIWLIKIGWLSLTLSIVLGLLYLYSLTSHLVLFSRFKKTDEKSEEHGLLIEAIYYVWTNHMKIEFLQFFCFTIGFISIVVFSIFSL
jgi:hypothetical protein